MCEIERGKPDSTVAANKTTHKIGGLILSEMSTAIKMYGYMVEEIETFVEEQRGRDAGRWEYWAQQQNVRLSKVHIVFGYARSKLVQR